MMNAHDAYKASQTNKEARKKYVGTIARPLLEKIEQTIKGATEKGAFECVFFY